MPRDSAQPYTGHFDLDEDAEVSLEVHPHVTTFEQIDVLWLKGRSMARAFEVEHTTAIYSGLLRMADLLALQPNMDIRLHIVAPDERRDKVLREIKRPVFSLLDRGPLYEKCTYLPYEAIEILKDTPHLAHMSDSIVEEFEYNEFGQPTRHVHPVGLGVPHARLFNICSPREVIHV